MLDMFLLGLAALAQDEGPIFTGIDPAQGPTIGENRTLSQWHPGSDERMFPDIAVKDLRIDGDTLYVLVTNEGRKNAARVQITARAESNGVKRGAGSARLSTLSAGERKWVSLGHFALANTNMISAAVRLPAPPALDRSGQGCVACTDVNQANDSFSAAPSSIARGKPE